MVASLRAELERAQGQVRAMGERVVVQSIDTIVSSAREGKGGVRFYLTDGDELDDALLIDQGQRTIKADPRIVYLAVVPRGTSVRVLAFVGPDAIAKGLSAGDVVREVARALGGSGGGSSSFAQGGGPVVENLEEARTAAIRLLSAPIVSSSATSQKG
jgi:alanyl-tRNA synthetase